MANIDTLPDAVQWSEGMLLSPQHLQQNDIYWQEQLRHRLACLTPNYWGVASLQLVLANDLLTVSQLECVLPNGLAVQHPGPGAAPLALDLSTVRAADGPQRIWLWVRDRGPQAARKEDPNRRYDSILGKPIADENTGSDEIDVPRLRLRYALHAGAGTPSRLGACALAEVARDANGQLALTRYHPPMLCLEASAFQQAAGLQIRLAGLHQRLWAKLAQLAADGDGAPQEAMDEGRDLDQARALACCLPQLAIAIDPQSRPEDLYRALAQVVGQVAALGGNPMPLAMAPYRHQDCLPQFDSAIAYIDDKLAQIESLYAATAFDPRGSTGFTVRLGPQRGGELLVELRARPGQRAEQLASWLDASTIAGENTMLACLQQRLRGAEALALRPDEVKARKLRPQANWFLLRNPADGSQDYLAPGQVLYVKGEANADMPAGIVLHRNKPGSSSVPDYAADAPELIDV